MACQTNYNPETRIWSGPPEDFDTAQPIGVVLLANLKARGDKVMQIFDDRTVTESMTAAEMYRRSVRLAGHFRRHGIKAGTVVTVHLQNMPDTAPTVIALFAVGAILNVLSRDNMCSRPTEVKGSFLVLAQPQFIVCHADMVADVERHAAQVGCAAEVITFEACDGRSVSVEAFLGEYDDDDAEVDFDHPEIANTDTTTALILASSGTTGTPKAVHLSHGLVLSQIKRCTLNKDIGIMFNPSPLDWISGVDNFIGSVYRGKTRIVCRLPITAERFVDIVGRHLVTDTFCDPSRMYQIDGVLSARGQRLTSVQLLVCSGTLASEELQLKILECFPNAGVAVGYGLTEIGGLATASLMGQRGFSVGFLLRGIHMRIAGVRGGKALGPGDVGELFVRGSHPLGRGDVGSNCSGDWLSTDDVGYFDADGFLFIVGRKGDQLQFGPHAIAPIDIESVLERHEDVLRAAVVGVSVPVYNDLPAAVCVRRVGSELEAPELQRWVRDKLTDSHQLRGGIYFVDELPLTANGKVRKIVCKEWAFRLYNATESSRDCCGPPIDGM